MPLYDLVAQVEKAKTKTKLKKTKQDKELYMWNLKLTLAHLTRIS